MNNLPWVTKAASKGIDYFKQNKKKNTTAASTNYNNPYYNPYKDVYGIYKAGNDWQAAQNEEKRKEIQKNAQNYYNNLISGGYNKLADTLSKSDSQTRLSYANQYGKQGKTAIRPYFKSLAGQYGLSESDIDNNLRYDNDTGEVFFYGQNMGKPSSVVDGTSYWDTDVLDTNFSNAMNRMGKSKSDDVLYKQGVSDVQNIYRNNDAFIEKGYNDNTKAIEKNNSSVRGRTDEYADFVRDYLGLAKRNPLTNSEADAIYSIYGAKGDNAAYGAVADSAGSNSGNIDSFAAANARRQQLAFKNAATEAILNANQARLNNILAAGERLGIRFDKEADYMTAENAQRENSLINAANLRRLNASDFMTANNSIFDNSETGKLNAQKIASQQIDDKVKIAGVTGYVPPEWVNAYNEFLNEDGSLKDKYKNADFKAIMEKARENGDNELLKQASVARMKKIWGDYSKYGQYDDGDYTVDSRQKTENARQFDINDATTNKQIDAGLAAALGEAEANTAAAKAEADAKNNAALLDYQLEQDKIASQEQQNENDNKTALEIARLKQAGLGGATVGSSKLADGTTLNNKIDSIIKNFNSWIDSKYADDEYKIYSGGTSGYVVPDDVQEKFAHDILKDNTLTAEQKQYILELFNIPDSKIYELNTDPHYSSGR